MLNEYAQHLIAPDQAVAVEDASRRRAGCTRRRHARGGDPRDRTTTRPSSCADLVIERLDRGALAQMLVLGSRAEEALTAIDPDLELICEQVPELASSDRHVRR